MLIDLTRKTLKPDHLEWCKELFEKVININKKEDRVYHISQQQCSLLNSFQENRANIIKTYRCAGISTLMYVNTAYNMLYNDKNDEYKELYIYDSEGAARNAIDKFLSIIDVCSEYVYLLSKNRKSIQFRFENKKSMVRFISQSEADKDVLTEQYDLVNIENAAWIKNERITKDLPDTLKRNKSRVNISSTPHTENGFFYDIWKMTISGGGHFKPTSMKWYLDPNFNKELRASSGLLGYQVSDIGMICEALEHGDMLTNKWYEERKALCGSSYISEIDGDFVDRYPSY